MRLVKGAYWDSEIKWAQERGLADYPVLTRKLHTDVSYLACLRLMLSDRAAFYPQFATHNAQSIAAVSVAATSTDAYEFQRLHGMGEAVYEEVVGSGKLGVPCRIYAPVGPHADLVAYLVRRLLENGANTSFVNRLANEEAPIAEIIKDPVATVEAEKEQPSRQRLLPKPQEMFAPERANSRGMALDQPSVRAALRRDVEAELKSTFAAAPIVDGKARPGRGAAEPVLCPHDRRQRLGTVHVADAAAIETAIASAAAAAHAWDRLGGPARAAVLDRAADLYERDRVRLMAVMVREAGKTLENALGDVREAIDFLRYYAMEARRLFSGSGFAQGADGRDQHHRAAGPRAVCLHQPVEFSAGDLHGPGGSGAGRRQSGARQAGRADADRRVPRHAAAARGRRAAGRAASAAGRRRRRRGAGEGSARGGRRLHGLERDRLGDPERARRAARRHRAVHRRDRRPQCHDRRTRARCPSR